MTDKNDTLPEKIVKEDIKQDNFSLRGDKDEKSSSSKPNYALRALLLLIVFLAGISAGVYFLPTLKERLPIVAQWIGEDDTMVFADLNEKVSSQQSSIDQLTRQTFDQEKRLNQLSATPDIALSSELETRLEALEANLFSEQANNAPSIDTSQSNRIDMLLSRMSQLEASFIPLSKNMIDVAEAQKERDALQEDNLSLNEKIVLLQDRLDTLEVQAARDNTGLLLNVKIAELKKKVVSGEVYEKELETVRRLIEGGALKSNSAMSEAVEKLDRYASSGLVTPDQLKRSFNNFIPNLITAKNMDASASWWQNTLNKLQNMITVRKTDSTTDADKTIDGLIADIESWLDKADLRSVLEVVEALPFALQQLIGDWQTDVEDWLYGEEAIETLESIAAESYLVLNSNLYQENLA